MRTVLRGGSFIVLEKLAVAVYFVVVLIFILCFPILYVGSLDVVKAGNYEEKQIL